MNFALACKALCVSTAEKKEIAGQHLSIAKDFMDYLVSEDVIIKTDYMTIVEELLQTVSPIKFSDHMQLMVPILENISTKFKNNHTETVNENRKICSRIDYKIIGLYYDIENLHEQDVAKVKWKGWSEENVADVLKWALENQKSPSSAPEHKMVCELADSIISKKYKSDVYPLFIDYLIKEEKWVKAFHLIPVLTELTDSPNEAFGQSLEKIENEFKAVEKYKTKLSEVFKIIIGRLLSKEKLYESQVKNWTEECGLMTREQLNHLSANPNFLESVNAMLHNFITKALLTMDESMPCMTYEMKDHAKYIYDIFGLGHPPETLHLDQFKIVEPMDVLGTVDGDTQNEVWKALKRGKTKETVAEFYDITLDQVNAIQDLKMSEEGS